MFFCLFFPFFHHKKINSYIKKLRRKRTGRIKRKENERNDEQNQIETESRGKKYFFNATTIYCCWHYENRKYKLEYIKI